MITPSIDTTIGPTPKRKADDKPDRIHGNIELQWKSKPNTEAFKKEP